MKDAHQWFVYAVKRPELCQEVEELNAYVSKGELAFSTSPSTYQGVFNMAAGLKKVKLLVGDNGGKFVSALAAAGCPLRHLSVVCHSNSLLSTLDAEVFEKWRPTLRRLVLLEAVDPHNDAASRIMVGIVKHLGNSLKALAITATDWSVLRPITALKELYVRTINKNTKFIDANDVKTAAELQLATNPPGIGLYLNLSTLDFGRFHTLLTDAWDNNVYEAIDEIIKLGYDPNREVATDCTTWRRSSQLLVGLAQIHLPKSELVKLIEPGKVEVFGKGAADGQRTTVFRTALTASWNDGLLMIYKRLFEGEIWTKAREKYSLVELLGGDFEFLFDSEFHFEQFKYIMAHPEVFGTDIWRVKRESGPETCDFLLHSLEQADKIELLLDNTSIDWKELDCHGRDAIDCLVTKGWSYWAAVAKLMLRACPDDSDFIRHCTPMVWASLGGLESFEDSSNPVGACIERMVRVFPGDRPKWKVLLAACAQSHLRISHVNIIERLILYNGPNAEEIREVLIEALEEPFDVRAVPWAKPWPGFFAPRALLPMPHLLSYLAEHHGAALSEIMSRLRRRQGRAAFEAFLGQTDANGRNWKQHLHFYGNEWKISKAEEYLTWK